MGSAVTRMLYAVGMPHAENLYHPRRKTQGAREISQLLEILAGALFSLLQAGSLLLTGRLLSTVTKQQRRTSSLFNR